MRFMFTCIPLPAAPKTGFGIKVAWRPFFWARVFTASLKVMCDRRLPLWRCVCTFVGTWVSAASILSLTGSVYESGLSALTFSVVPWFLGALLIVLISGRLYAAGVTTVPELFRVRYGSRGLQAAYGALLAAVYVLYLVIQIKGFGIVASTLFGIPYSVAILLVYLFILYTSFGGYQSVTRSDVFNLILMIVGLGVLLVIVVARVGSFGGIYSGAAEVTGYAHAGMQAKLLTFLEDRCFKRVGGLTDIPVDVRVVAATNRRLEDEIAKGTFREDLFYRLNVMGSRSTYMKAKIGGFKGRKLEKEDVLNFRAPGTEPKTLEARSIAPEFRARTEYTLRVVLGPQDDAFTAAGIETFLTGVYAVTAEFDRMGCRLEGPEIAHG